MPAAYFDLSYKQHAVWLLSWPPPWRGEPIPESYRENGPNSRTNGTARGTQSPNRPAGKVEEKKQEGWSAKCPGIKRILARRPTAPAQLQTRLLPGGLSADLCCTDPGSSLQWLPIVPGS